MRVSPQLYDLDPRDLLKVDIPFYLRMLDKSQPVLDVGVGTGRIAIQLARNGFNVTGIDPDIHMLSQAVAAIWRESSTTQSRIQLHHSNILTFESSAAFGSILFGHRTFQAILSRDSQTMALKRAAACLVEDGQIIVSLPHEFDDISDDWKGRTSTDWTLEQKGGIQIKRSTERSAYDRSERTLSLCLVYEINFSADSSIEIREPLTLAHISDMDFRSLLPECGLVVESAFGGYGKEPLGNGSEMLYVLRHSNAGKE
jgi:SAM-dependent methyltransferase